MLLNTAIFSISCLLLSLVHHSSSQLNACGHPIPANGFPTATCTGCTTLKICTDETSFTEGSCGPSKYCNDMGNNLADCTDVPSASCELDIGTPEPEGEDGDPEEGSILCTGVGIYPDPTDCNIYHYCPGQNRFSWVQTCPPEYAFSYSSPAASDRFPCKQIKTAATDCVKVACAGGDILKSYGSSKIFYARCSGEDRLEMMKCSDGATFNGTECVFKCTKDGLYANTVDPSRYYQCYFVGRTLAVREKDCPEGRKFDQAQMVCL